MSFFHAFLKRRQYEAEIETKRSADTKGVRFLTQVTRFTAPIYVGGVNIQPPVGGGLSTEWQEQGSAVRITYPNKEYYTIRFMNPTEGSNLETHTFIANDLSGCKPVLEHYSMYDRIPVSIPMKLEYFRIPGDKVYVHMNTGLIDNQKARLLNHVVWKKRLPGTLTIPFVALIVYGMASIPYSNPTNISGKIKKALNHL